MPTKFSEDVISLAVLKEAYEKNEEQWAFMAVISIGLMDLRAGKELELDEVKARLGIE